MSTIIEVQPTPGGGSVSITEADIPAGGTTGQVLSKVSAADYDVQWSTVSGGGSVTWDDVTGKPSTFTPSAHAHIIAEVTGLQTALDGKQASGSYAAAVHTHIIGDVTGLQTALDGKQAAGSYAAASHTHIIGDVTGLQTALDGKQAAGSYQPLATVLTNTTASFTTAQETKLSGITAGASVSSVSGTGTVSGLTLTGTVTTTGNLTLGGTLSVAASNFASQTANTFLAAPNGAAGVPAFRAIAAADIPTLNQSTTGSAATLTTGRTIGMTGDVTWTSASFNGSGNVTGTSTIGNNVVSLAKMATVTTGTFLGRVTAATGNVEALTGTQATTLLDVFTTSLKGVVPASGGGTTNFLRADGTWAAPPGGGGGSPGGSTTQIQFNNAGTFGGSADFTWDDSGKVLGLNGTDTGIDLTAITNEPAAPASGKIHVYGKAIAGRMMLKVKGPSGIDTPLQPALFQNRIMMYVPSTGTTGTGSGTGIGPVWTSGGTVTHPTPSTTAPAISNQMNRTRYANVVTTTNQTLGIKAAAADSLKYWIGSSANLGGFQYAARFIVELYPASTVRIFAGLTASSATYVVASDTVLNNTCGLWHDTTAPSTGAGAFNFVTRNTTTTTKQQITLSNAIAAGNSYDFYMWCAPNGGTIYWRLDDVVNGVTYEGSTSTTLPVNTAFMGPQCAMSNGTANITVTTSAIGIAGVYAESDR